MTFQSALRSFVPISQFNKGQAGKIFDRLKTEQRLMVLKNNAPAAVILSPEEYYRITEYECEQELVRAAHERMQGDWESRCIPEKDVLEMLGITEEDIAAAENLEVE
ncbi:MAG: type II toxin-antitoxin system Phd/YefM family antitoxin [Oscillospiraceae bacterium]|nr:type II toxin-antitoxin system Phd/YefM family antitoxin [Oscillospiraceae bacterium]